MTVSNRRTSSFDFDFNVYRIAFNNYFAQKHGKGHLLRKSAFEILAFRSSSTTEGLNLWKDKQLQRPLHVRIIEKTVILIQSPLVLSSG